MGSSNASPATASSPSKTLPSTVATPALLTAEDGVAWPMEGLVSQSSSALQPARVHLTLD